MIRQVGQHEDPTEYLAMMEERLRAIESQAGTHITWYTHKNPYGCWICDMFLVCQSLIDSFAEFLGPTAADASAPSNGLSDSATSESAIDDVESEEEEEG